jgi:hypothetical protein
VADLTRRWRADSRVSYARALLALIEYARARPSPDFAFGPLSVASLEAYGLTVSGTDLTGPSDVLSTVPGLVEVPA